MKKIILALLFFSNQSLLAKEGIQTLICGDKSNSAEQLKIELHLQDIKDTSYVRPTSGSLRWGYAHADLKCTGYSLDNLSCVGFWFNLGDMIVHAKTQLVDGQIVASYKNLTESPIAELSGMVCMLNK